MPLPAAEDAYVPPRWSSYVLLAILVLGGALRLLHVRESLWVDELHTAWCASGSLAEVAPRALAGNQSPVFFWLEWLLVNLLGHRELVLRLPSLLAGVLLPLALYLLAIRWTRSPGVALVAAALAAVDPRLIFDATEARPYALVELLAIAHVAIFAKLVLQPTLPVRLAFILVAALLFHLHFTAALLLPAEIAFWLLARSIDPAAIAYRMRQLAFDLFFVAALMAPALEAVLIVAQRRDNWAAFVLDQSAIGILRVFFWSAALLFVLIDPDAFLRTAWLLQEQAAPRHAKVNRERPLLLAVSWLVVPLAISWILTASNIARLFFPRYLLFASPAAILLAALCTRLPRFPALRCLLGLALVALAAGFQENNILQQLRHDGRAIDDRREDWRSANAWLDTRHIDHPLPILLASGLIEANGLRQPHTPTLEAYCLFPLRTRLYPLHKDAHPLIPLPLQRPGKLEAAARQQITDSAGAWIVVRGSTRSANRVLNDAVVSLRAMPGGAARRWMLAEQRSFGNLHILRLEQADKQQRRRQ